MTPILALLGAKALYLLIVWLAAAIICSWLSVRSGYGERPGLASGLLLTAVGIIPWLIIYLAFPRAGSPRALEGVLPRRHTADERPG
jgi:hypothetical protein